MDTLGTLVLDDGSVKAERQRYHTITKRYQEHGQHIIPSITNSGRKKV
jgi:putative transposase